MASRDGVGPWRRSSYSGGNGNCVEVAPLASWRKSSHSGTNGDCVEVAAFAAHDGRAVRDSKDPSGPVLTFGDAEWSAFISGAKRGAFASGR
ncbi:DUF397 domain-containing protein [Streptomyces sp. 6N223]|uniref:DUF397 domain-containing protein n=1 Tax=Streptomyces sp. 6N223 TaxID=3457412 RepID=UPI003FD4662A